MPGKSKIGSSESKNWLRLDNAAKIFPVISNSVRTSVFRLSIELNDAVKIKELQQALDESLKEYPYFRSQLKKGFFWYWLENSEAKPLIQFDQGPPSRAFKVAHRNHLLFRILAKEKMISAEFMHVLCDAGGGMQFLQAIVRKYGNLCGWELSEDTTNHTPDNPKGQMEDSYKKYFNKYLPKPAGLSKAYHLPFKIGKKPVLKVTCFETSTTELIKASKKYKVSLTEYLASVYLHVLQSFYLKSSPKEQRKNNSVLRIEIPVNLRNIFPSNTLRNFALFIMPEIDPRLGAYSFEEITQVVHHYMQLETDKRQIMRIIRRNVGGEKNLMIRAIPLFLKIPVLFVAFSLFGPNLYSGLITNFGRSNLPEAFAPYVNRFRFYPPPPDKKIRVSMAMISHGEKLVFSFGNLTNTMKFEQEVIRFLRDEGLNLKILKP